MITPTSIPGYINLDEAAAIIGVSHSQAWRYIDAGILDAVKIGNTHLVKKRDAERFERPPRGNPAFTKKSA